MRRALGPLPLPMPPLPAALPAAVLAALLVVGVAGCGNDTGTTASDSASDRTTASGSPSAGSSSGSSTGSGPAETVALLSRSNAGGRVDPSPTVLDSQQAIDSFAGQFDDSDLGAKLRTTVKQADPGPGRVLAAAVVSIGCDVPPGVEVQRTADGLHVTAQPAKASTKECFVPVTTVAVVDVDASLVG